MSIAGARLMFQSEQQFRHYRRDQRRMLWFFFAIIFLGVLAWLLPHTALYRYYKLQEKISLNAVVLIIAAEVVVVFLVSVFSPIRYATMDFEVNIGMPWPLPVGIIVRCALEALVAVFSAFLLFMVSGSKVIDGEEVEMNDWWGFAAAILLTLHSSCLWRLFIGGAFNFALMNLSGEIVIHLAVDHRTTRQYLAIICTVCLFILFCLRDLVHRGDIRREGAGAGAVAMQQLV